MQVLILLLTDSNKIVMHWREPYIMVCCVGANNSRVKMRSKTKTYHVNLLKNYIAREPDPVLPTSNEDGATVAVACVTHEDTDFIEKSLEMSSWVKNYLRTSAVR